MSSKVFDSGSNMLAPDKNDNELKTMKQLKKAMRQKVKQEISDQKYGASMRDLFDHTAGKGPSQSMKVDRDRLKKVTSFQIAPL